MQYYLCFKPHISSGMCVDLCAMLKVASHISFKIPIIIAKNKCTYVIRKSIEANARMLSNCTIVVFLYPRHIAPTFVFIVPARDAHAYICISSPPHLSSSVPSSDNELVRVPVELPQLRAGSSFRPKTNDISLRFAVPPHLSFVESRSIFATAMHTKGTKGSSTLRRTKMNVCLGLCRLLLFHEHRVPQSSRKIRADIIDRRRPVLVRFPSMADGTSQPSLSLLCA